MRKYIILVLLLLALPVVATTPKYLTVHTTGGSLSYKISDIRKVIFEPTSEGNLEIHQKQVSTVAKYPYSALEWLTYDEEAGISDIFESEGKIEITMITDIVKVSSTRPIQQVQVYDMNGKLLYNSTPGSEEECVSLNGYPKGLYVIKAVTAEMTKTEKIVKN